MWEDMWNVNFPVPKWEKRDIFTCLVKISSCSNLDHLYINHSNPRNNCTPPPSHRSFPKPLVALSHLPFSKKVPNVHRWDWFGWKRCKLALELWFFFANWIRKDQSAELSLAKPSSQCFNSLWFFCLSLLADSFQLIFQTRIFNIE